MSTDITKLLRSDQTVFSFQDIALLTGENNPALLARRLSHYRTKGELYPLRKGFYAKDKNYNPLELATKIYTPAYISFETVLAKAGIIFQYYRQIFVASYLKREITVQDQTYTFRKIKESVLTDHTGIEIKGKYAIASPERAFLDMIYLMKDYHFDNLRSLSWEKVLAILPIYGGNRRMKKQVESYYRSSQK